MLYGLVFAVVLGVIIIISKGSKKYNEDNERAGKKDFNEFYGGWHNKNKHDKNY